MEQWLPLQEYPGYEISDQGRVCNHRGNMLAITRPHGARAYVGLMKDGVQVQRSLSLLVAKTFLIPPNDRHNTPIHFDGDLHNCAAINLAWRPRWFAIRHTAQFRMNLDNPNPVRNIDTGKEYVTIWQVVFEHGVLFNDVVKSIINKTFVFPLMERFEWIDPD